MQTQITYCALKNIFELIIKSKTKYKTTLSLWPAKIDEVNFVKSLLKRNSEGNSDPSRFIGYYDIAELD